MNTQQTPSLIDNVMVPLCDMDDHQVTWIKPSLIFTWMGFWLIPKKNKAWCLASEERIREEYLFSICKVNALPKNYAYIFGGPLQSKMILENKHMIHETNGYIVLNVDVKKIVDRCTDETFLTNQKLSAILAGLFLKVPHHVLSDIRETAAGAEAYTLASLARNSCAV
ncbi:MAG: hypothetical protein LRY41_02695 [Candidatus Pacebacteria bacterium]|nr:hypothetical protein [Candidatus Paceibacterota bacterium]MCD8528206.1 hypothetical protein [Candidatus Paceibacterota bacterium]MCD8563845.1 hypothetical protein [Candidatus Paceibacterota bacterium]